MKRYTQEGIVINTFLLETSQYLLDFEGHLIRINKGRTLYTTTVQLGEYVLVDYMPHLRKRVKS